MTVETLITLAGYGAAILAVCCVLSVVAIAGERWPRYVKPPIEVLCTLFMALLLTPLWLYVRVMDWAGNSQARQVVVLVGFAMVLWMLAWFFDHLGLLR